MERLSRTVFRNKHRRPQAEERSEREAERSEASARERRSRERPATAARQGLSRQLRSRS